MLCISFKNLVDDLWKCSNPIPNQKRINKSRLCKNFISKVFWLWPVSISLSVFFFISTLQNKQTSHLVQVFCIPTYLLPFVLPLHTSEEPGSVFSLPLCWVSIDSRTFSLYLLFQSGTISTDSASACMSCAPAHPPWWFCSRLRQHWDVLLLLQGSQPKEERKKCFLDLLTVLLLLLPGCGWPSVMKNMVLLSGNGCLRALSVSDRR